MTGASTIDLIGAVTGIVTAVLALLAAAFAVWWWFRRLRVVALIDPGNRIHVWLSNRGRTPREVLAVAVWAVRSRRARLQVQSQGAIDEPVVVKTAALREPLELEPGRGRLVRLRLTDEEMALPRPGAPGLEKRKPTLSELRVAIHYGDGTRSLRRLKQVKRALVAPPLA